MLRAFLFAGPALHAVIGRVARIDAALIALLDGLIPAVHGAVVIQLKDAGNIDALGARYTV